MPAGNLTGTITEEPSLQIKEATVHDVAVLAALGKATYLSHFAHYWHSQQELQAWVDEEYSVAALTASLNDPAVSWLLAIVDEPIGFAKLTLQQDHAHPGTLLNKLYFTKAATGQGYGQVLFAEAVARAKSSGSRYFCLEVLQGNDGARRFYESRGMRHLRDEVFSTPEQTSVLHIYGMAI